MKKTLAILLSLALLITAIPLSTAMAESYTTATDFYTLSNWVGPSSADSGADGSTYIEMGYLRLAERSFAMTLKENTTYTLSFKVTATWGLNGAGKLYIGDTLKVYQTDDTTQTDIVTSKTGHDAWLAYGASSVVTMQFTTGTATGYTLYFKGNWQEDNAALGGKFTEFALTEVPQTPTYTTATDFYTLSNWVGPSSADSGADGATNIEMGYLRAAERTFAMTLKASTVYTLSFKVTATWGSDGTDKLYFDGGIKVLDASETDIVTSRSGDDAWLAYGASSVVTLQFTTGTDTAYTLYMKGGWWNNAALGGKFTEFALNEYVEPTDLENATEAIADKFTGTQYASIRAKDGDKAQGLRVRSDIDTSVLGDAALADCTVVEYGTLVAKTENLGGAAMTVDMVGTDKKVVKGVAYNKEAGTDIIYKLDGTTKSFTLVLINIPVERFVTSYSYRAYAILEDADGNTATVYGGATTAVSVESVATDIVNSETASETDKAAAQTALDELEAYEATQSYTTAADLADAANWVAGGDTTLTQIEGGVQMQAWYTVYASLFTTLNLKPNTTYTITASFEGDCYTTLLSGANGVAVVPASVYSTETASGAAWPVDLIEANNIGSGYTHEGKTSGTMTVTFTTTDETEYTLGVRDSGRGSVVTWACSPLVKFTNFTITEN